MGKTIIEKIMTSHSDEEASAGKIVWIEIDLRTARDFGGANVVKNFQKYYPNENVHDDTKTFFTFDCVVPANNIPYANNQQFCRLFAREQGIKVFDCDRGIGSHVDIEEGLALPGAVVVGTDSHLNILGAIGAFGQGMGDQDIAFAFKAGKTWFEVPETMKIVIKGQLPTNTTAKDLTLFVLRKLGSKGALGKAMEFYGEAIDSLKLAGRITLASMATEMGGIIGLIPPNQEIIDYCNERSARNNGNKVEPVYADEDAEYCETIEIDITDLKPQIAQPPKPDNVANVDEISGTPIDSAFIGSCTNGTYEDIAAAARLLKGRKIKEGIMATVVPGTKEVYGKLLHEGMIQTLFEGGVMVTSPGCGGCASGQVGMTGENEVKISSSNRNFPGKQGAGSTYLASPETAMASAILGKIVTATDLEKEGE
ncbi:MAG: 3-isopropylmalate dehydratase large subunit [Thermoplasmata archaeon]|nr:3-isopropylmalate dehydratase large subunit [Thermoplasmata archaeon]